MRRTFDETVRGWGGGGSSDGAVVGGGSGGGTSGGTSGGASGDSGGGALFVFTLFVFTLSAFTACRQSWYASSVKTRRLRGGKTSDATTWHV
jgi:hypothetical protein